MLIPALLAFVAVFGACRGVDIYAAMIKGAGDGLKTAIKIMPPVIIMLSAVAILRQSGFFELFTKLTAPVLSFLGIPAEVTPIILIRPFSGTGALAVVSDILSEQGADSYAGRVASVMMGSTETTFYVLAVYFGATKNGKLKKAIFAALLADFVGYVVSALAVRLLF